MNTKEEFYKRTSKTNNTDNRWKVFAWGIVYQYLFRTSPKALKEWRCFLLRCFGAKIGKKCQVAPTAFITRPWEFEMGYYSSIDDNCFVIPPVKVGDEVAIANNCHIIAGGHNIFSREFEQEFNPIIIGNSSFLCCGVYVSMGCRIGTASVVSSHIKILKNVPDNTVVAQLPNGKTVNIPRVPETDFDNYRYYH